MCGFTPGQKLLLHVLNSPIRPSDERRQFIRDWNLPFEYQWKQLGTFFGVNTSSGLVPLVLLPQFMVYFPFPTVRVPVNLMVENCRSDKFCSWSHYCCAWKFSLPKWNFHMSPFQYSSTFQNFLSLVYHPAREFTHFQWVICISLT